jgi:enoyl-CoA hydratase/carnithine racemase
MCDIIYAGNRAKFGLPEIKLGTIPGGGGTQRLIRAVGKTNAMEMIFTGKHISAEEALILGIDSGLYLSQYTHQFKGIVSKVFEEDKLVKEAIKLGQEIGKYSILALEAAKEAVLKGNLYI